MIYILGGEGFIGSALVRACARQGLIHRVINRDNYSQLVGSSCSVLINANGNSKKYLAIQDPVTEFDASVRSVRSTLLDFNFDSYVYLSSCDIYPDCSSPAATNEDRAIDVTHQSPYGFHKFLAEQCVRHGAAQSLILRLGGCIGPGLRKGPIYDIMSDAPLWLDLDSELQFMHTDDLASIALTLVNRGLWGQLFNVCGQGTVRLRTVVEFIGRAVAVNPDSPRVRYDVNINKLSGVISEVPGSEQAVLAFVSADGAR